MSPTKASKQQVRRIGFTLSMAQSNFYSDTIAISLSPGQYLQCLRVVARLTRHELASRLQIHPNTLENWESDAVEITKEKLERVTQFLLGGLSA